METYLSGYREVAHTADWELEVWAPTLAELLCQAAHGMYALSGVQLADQPRLQRQIDLEASDPEGLLVTFLSELLYIGETEGLAFDQIKIEINNLTLHAELNGAPIIKLDKEIKAVTYHNLSIRAENNLLRANIVFDV
jgi:SHS2 domain-containing protein